MPRFIKQLMPFVFIGIAIVAFIFGIMLLAYLFFFGALLGLIIFITSWIRDKLFSNKTPPQTIKRKSPGRVIDSDDWKKM